MTEEYAQRMYGDGAPDPQKIAEAVVRPRSNAPWHKAAKNRGRTP